MYLRLNRAFRLLRLRMLSRLDNSGTRQEVVAISIADNREFQGPEHFSCFHTWSLKHSSYVVDFLRQLVKARVIRRRKRTNDNVIRFRCRKNLQPYQFTQSATQSISLHDRMTVLANNYRGSLIRRQGCVGPNVEVFGTQSSPCLLYPLQI